MPRLWLISDARNDAMLDHALRRLPRGSGFIFRHYHLDPVARRARFNQLAALCAGRSITLVLADTPEQARLWGADGSYGPPLPRRIGAGGIRLATAHNLRDLARAGRCAADAVLLSPVFPTRSHPGTRVLGAVRFRLLARWTKPPVIALGGMNPARAKRLDWPRWAAIDGLACRDS